MMIKESERPIVVDLDGTLVLTDLLIENVFLVLRHNPFTFFTLVFSLFRGKAYFKMRFADVVLPDVKSLPYNLELIDWLQRQRAKGRILVLATASNERIARHVALHLDIFDDVLGSGEIDLSSYRKRAALVEKFGEMGFEYVGNSKADLPVWRSAAQIHIVNPEFGVMRAASKLGNIGLSIRSKNNYWGAVLKAIRLHQWAKNALIFVPLLASHRIFELPIVLDGLLAFLSFGLCASSVYLLNDLLDLPNDRQHPTKRNRPLAAGTLPILHALFLIPGLLLAAFVLALWQLPLQFTAVLAGYYLLTSAYSLGLKRAVMLDVVTLSMLYTSRVIAGAAAMALVATFWILAFCTFIFLSLALVKRYSELYEGHQNGNNEKISGRGYYPSDFELLASLGGASGYISVLVLALYINESASATLYQSTEWMWLALPLLLYWLNRVWLIAHRGEMHDDPIVFALRDSVSRWTGLAFLAVFGLATL